jgi:hypothetical protein
MNKRWAGLERRAQAVVGVRRGKPDVDDADVRAVVDQGGEQFRGGGHRGDDLEAVRGQAAVGEHRRVRSKRF